MDNNQIEVLPFLIITFAIFISGITVVFAWQVVFLFSARLKTSLNKYFQMNFATILILTIFFTVSLYIIFLLLGVGGIEKNRKAQGIEQINK